MENSFEAAARSLKIEPIIAPVHDDVEIETAIIGLGREPGGGLLTPDVFTIAHCEAIISAAARNNVPAVYGAQQPAMPVIGFLDSGHPTRRG